MQSPSASGTPDDALPRAGLMSRATIGKALDLLQAAYSLDDRGMAFAVFRYISQQHNVKLREVAAAFVPAHDGDDAHTGLNAAASRAPKAPPPALSFCAPKAHSNSQHRRSEVLQALMRATQVRTDAQRMTVQATDRLFGGLRIEAHHGFKRSFSNFFGYIDGADASACASALARGRPVVVDDVETSAVFDEGSRQVMIEAGSHAVLSVPIVDERDVVCAVVSAHFTEAGIAVGDETLRAVRRQARECTRWLRWHDDVVMPTVLAAVHRVASAAVQVSAGQQPRAIPFDVVGRAEADLMQRYEITAGEARAVLDRLASANGVRIEEVAGRFVEASGSRHRRQRSRRVGARRP